MSQVTFLELYSGGRGRERERRKKSGFLPTQLALGTPHVCLLRLEFRQAMEPIQHLPEFWKSKFQSSPLGGKHLTTKRLSSPGT